jgi:hypothetical protein
VRKRLPKATPQASLAPPVLRADCAPQTARKESNIPLRNVCAPSTFDRKEISMGILLELLTSLTFSIYAFRDYRAYEDDINSAAFNVFSEKNRKAILLAISVLNYAFLAVICVMACIEIGSQIDLSDAAREVTIAQILTNILIYTVIMPLLYFKRKKIVREIVREFERSRTEPYTDDELYEHVREHIVISKKELAKMLRSIKNNP